MRKPKPFHYDGINYSSISQGHKRIKCKIHNQTVKLKDCVNLQTFQRLFRQHPEKSAEEIVNLGFSYSRKRYKLALIFKGQKQIFDNQFLAYEFALKTPGVDPSWIGIPFTTFKYRIYPDTDIAKPYRRKQKSPRAGKRFSLWGKRFISMAAAHRYFKEKKHPLGNLSEGTCRDEICKILARSNKHHHERDNEVGGETKLPPTDPFMTYLAYIGPREKIKTQNNFVRYQEPEPAPEKTKLETELETLIGNKAIDNVTEEYLKKLRAIEAKIKKSKQH